MEVNFNRYNYHDHVQKSLWWDPACDEAKTVKYKSLRKFRLTISQDDFISNKIHRFKALCKVKKKEFQQRRRSALIDTKDNPKLFWQTIKYNSLKPKMTK